MAHPFCDVKKLLTVVRSPRGLTSPNKQLLGPKDTIPPMALVLPPLARNTTGTRRNLGLLWSTRTTRSLLMTGTVQLNRTRLGAPKARHPTVTVLEPVSIIRQALLSSVPTPCRTTLELLIVRTARPPSRQKLPTRA